MSQHGGTLQAADIIQNLALTAHPEGGWYREVYRSTSRIETPRGRRSASTSIYYLLQRDQLSRWHTVDADEIWHFYGGAPLELLRYDPSARHLSRLVLEPAGVGMEPMGVVPAGMWQAARTLGDYSLVGCSVAPGFEFTDFHFVSAVPGHAEHFATTLDALRRFL